MLYQDPQDANAEHHGGAIELRQRRQALLHDGRALRRRGRPGRSRARAARSTASTPTARSRPTIPSTTERARTWTRSGRCGLRNPLPRLLRRADGQAATSATSAERQRDLEGGSGPRRGGRQLRLAQLRGDPAAAPCTSPIYAYPHNGRDASITGGFVYHGTQFPSSYQGSYFFADYTQNWIRRLTFDAQRQRHRRLQLRAGRRLARRPLRRHRLPHRGPRRRPVLRRPRLLGHQRHRSASARSAGSATSQSNQPPGAVASASPPRDRRRWT